MLQSLLFTSSSSPYSPLSLFHKVAINCCIWRVKGPLLDVRFLPWSMDNLPRRYICIVEWCCMCKKSGEYVDHLLLHCEFAFQLWSLVFFLLYSETKKPPCHSRWVGFSVVAWSFLGNAQEGCSCVDLLARQLLQTS